MQSDTLKIERVLLLWFFLECIIVRTCGCIERLKLELFNSLTGFQYNSQQPHEQTILHSRKNQSKSTRSSFNVSD